MDSLDERGLGVGVAVADVDDRGDPSDSDDGLAASVPGLLVEYTAGHLSCLHQRRTDLENTKSMSARFPTEEGKVRKCTSR